MIEPTGLVGRSYDLKLATQTVPASLTSIKHQIDIQTFQKKPCKGLHLNDIAVCVIATQRPIVYAPFEDSKTLGGFILIDRMTHATVAAGVIRHTMRRAQNVHTQPLTITRGEREKLNAHKGRVIWFTGLSGSGKSTYANALEIALHSDGYRTYLLDGDNVRHGLSKDLGFSEEDRVENIRRVAEVAKLMLDAGLVVIASFISPFARDRQRVRELVGDDHFVEVYVATPLEVCEARDPKGLYGQARKGLIPNFSGINSPYEAPVAPDVLLQYPMTIEEGVSLVQEKLKDLRSV
jgi:bifunctional enzyme CysN/CysC